MLFGGLAFKPRTDDVREAPALYLIEKLHEAGARVQAYDPIAAETAAAACKAPFTTSATALEALIDADALAIVTEWNEFRTPDLVQLKGILKSPVIFDGRNVLDPAKVTLAGFTYYCIGRQIVGERAAASAARKAKS